jgi:hypothetical protein
MQQITIEPPAPGRATRRSDAGIVRITGRDIAGLMLCGEMYGAPYDLLATYLDVSPDRVRTLTARWRAAGHAQTGRLGPGPAWCWLTRTGLAATGLGFAAAPPSLGRLGHLRAVLAARMSLEASEAGRAGTPWWRSERLIRAAAGAAAAASPGASPAVPAGGAASAGHIPDAEVSWPETEASPYPGQRWAVEVELAPRPLARMAAVMGGLLDRHHGYSPAAAHQDRPRYDRAVYLVSPAARGIVQRAAAELPAPWQARVRVRDLPADYGSC